MRLPVRQRRVRGISSILARRVRSTRQPPPTSELAFGKAQPAKAARQRELWGVRAAYAPAIAARPATLLPRLRRPVPLVSRAHCEGTSKVCLRTACATKLYLGEGQGKSHARSRKLGHPRGVGCASRLARWLGRWRGKTGGLKHAQRSSAILADFLYRKLRSCESFLIILIIIFNKINYAV